MTNTFKTSLFGAALLMIFSVIYLMGSYVPHAFSSAPSGLQATVATTSRPTVSATANLIMASSSCSARVISTATSSIMIGFSDNQGFVPSAMQGFFQAASTTVSYDSGQYGCGALRIFSFQTQAITVLESN